MISTWYSREIYKICENMLSEVTFRSKGYLLNLRALVLNLLVLLCRAQDEPEQRIKKHQTDQQHPQKADRGRSEVLSGNELYAENFPRRPVAGFFSSLPVFIHAFPQADRAYDH